MNDVLDEPVGQIADTALAETEGSDHAGQDKEATSEFKYLRGGKSQEQLQQEALQAEATRKERFRDHFEGLATAWLYMVWLAISVVAGIWLWHLLVPPSWHWLSEEQFGRIQAVLAGVIAGVAVGHLRRRLYD